MSPLSTPRQNEHWFALMKEPHIVKRALKVAFVVGSLLTLINQGPTLYSEQPTSRHYLQIALTYLVPYLVSSYSAVCARFDKN